MVLSRRGILLACLLIISISLFSLSYISSHVQSKARQHTDWVQNIEKSLFELEQQAGVGENVEKISNELERMRHSSTIYPLFYQHWGKILYLCAQKEKKNIAKRRKTLQESVNIFSHYALGKSPYDSLSLWYCYLAYKSLNQTQRAWECVERIASLDVPAPQGFCAKGMWLMKKNPIVDEKVRLEAMSLFTKALEPDPNFGYAYNQRGFIHLQNEDIQKAQADFQKAIDLCSDDPEAYLGIASICLRQKKDADALRYLCNAIETDPGFAVSWNSRGQFYMERGNTICAARDFEQATILNPNFAVAYNNFGLLMTMQKDFQKALELFSHAMQCEPMLSLSYMNRGSLYQEMGLYDNALEDYGHAIQLDPKLARAYNNRSLIYQSQKKWEQSLEDLNQAIALEKKEDFYLNRGILFVQINKNREALNDLECVKSEPIPWQVYYYKGVVCYRTKQYNQAIELWQKGKDRFPADIPIDELISKAKARNTE